MSNVPMKYLTDENNNKFSPVVSVDSVLTGGGKSLIDYFYPVGSYYETSDSSFNPNESWRTENGLKILLDKC